MKILYVMLSAICVAGLVQAQSAGPPLPHLRVVLVGDSTVNDGGGWGTGFRSYFSPEMEVVNLALNGRSSKSFRDEGAWAPALTGKPDYILIQFGHNDGPGKGPERETDAATTYRENMARYVNEARAAGAQPALVTSIVRRNFGNDGKIKRDSLEPYVDAVRQLAVDQHVPLIDLYPLTIAQAERLGPEGCADIDGRTADGKRDTTHLGPKGRSEVGLMAAKEFVRLMPALRPYVVAAQPAPSPRPSLFLVGDSIMKTGTNNGDTGPWGMGYELIPLFDAGKIMVHNEGLGGRSSRGYIEEGAWAKVRDQLQPGDYVIVMFGHNDAANSANYPDRVTLQGNGDESMGTVHSYGWYLRQYVRDAKAKGAVAIICSPVPRNTWVNGKIKRGFDGYAAWAADAAHQSGALFIDLNTISADQFDALGRERAAAYFNDNQHTTKAGARLNAAALADGIRLLKDIELAGYLSRAQPR